MLHLQPRLCDLLLSGVLLPAFFCHSAGLHSHLRLSQDEAEEDRLRPGQREDPARLYPAIGGEIITLILIPFIFIYGTAF